MDRDSSAGPGGRERDRRRSRALLVAVALTLLLCAALVRTAALTDSQLRFHPTRQYRSAIIARAAYLEGAEDVPEWRRAVATAGREREGELEPPVVGRLAAFGYRLAGGENLRLPRLTSILFWMAGSLLLFGIARRLGDVAGLLALSVFLFVPFGVMASRSFQPDPLMILLLIGTILALLRESERPGQGRLGVAAGLAASAILVKPVALFQILGAEAALGRGDRRRDRGRRLARRILFLGLALGPAALYYGLRMASGPMAAQAEKSFVPGLLVRAEFWQGWAEQIGMTVGWPLVLLGLAGLALCPERRYRRMIAGLWLGYLAFGLVFTYHVQTHDYYQLQLLPLVALSTAPLGLRVRRLLGGRVEDLRWQLAGALAALVVVTGPVLSRVSMAATETAEGRLLLESSTAPEIGDQVGHSTRTIVLALEYGKPLLYHAEISGVPWPRRSDMETRRSLGREVPSAERRFEELSREVDAEFFVVTDLRELEEQPDLRALLDSRFALHAESPHYRIYDLRSSGRP